MCKIVFKRLLCHNPQKILLLRFNFTKLQIKKRILISKILMKMEEWGKKEDWLRAWFMTSHFLPGLFRNVKIRWLSKCFTGDGHHYSGGKYSSFLLFAYLKKVKIANNEGEILSVGTGNHRTHDNEQIAREISAIQRSLIVWLIYFTLLVLNFIENICKRFLKTKQMLNNVKTFLIAT